MNLGIYFSPEGPPPPSEESDGGSAGGSAPPSFAPNAQGGMQRSTSSPYIAEGPRFPIDTSPNNETLAQMLIANQLGYNPLAGTGRNQDGSYDTPNTNDMTLEVAGDNSISAGADLLKGCIDDMSGVHPHDAKRPKAASKLSNPYMGKG